MTSGACQTLSSASPRTVAVVVVDDVRHSTTGRVERTTVFDHRSLHHEHRDDRHDALNSTPSSSWTLAARSTTSPSAPVTTHGCSMSL